MKRYIILVLSLLALSAVTYTIQVNVFHKPDDTFFYLLQDLAFVPMQILIVTLIVDRLLDRQAKKSLLQKLNMVIGVFFGEIGNDLIKLFSGITENFSGLSSELLVSAEWDDKKFNEKLKTLKEYPYVINITPASLDELKIYLISKRGDLMNLLENPNLLEHETFTDLLWAVFHLTDELLHRSDFSLLPESDFNHLKVDIIRAYRLIVVEWLAYMKHLKNDYPYLFSIAVRTNAFNPDSDIIVR